MAITLRRKQDDLPAWHLVNQADMMTAFTDLQADGWRGAITCDETGSVWRLELNADAPVRQIIATLGDWLIDDMGWRLVTAEECATNYDITEG